MMPTKDKVAIIGAGLMGPGIAARSTLAGHPTVLIDVSLDKAQAGHARGLEAIRQLRDNDLVEPGHGWTLQSADAVNDLGEIVGRGLNEAGEVRGFCLRPTSLRLMPPDPGLAGQPNAVAVSQATPYQTIYLVGSLLTGSTPIPGCGGGVSLDLANPVVLGIGAAGDRGRATFTIYVPAGLAGVEVHLQAVELANCRISNRQTFRF